MIDPKDMAAAFAVPAKLTRKFVIVRYPEGTLRMSFGEAPPGDGDWVFHTALAISYADAVHLVDTLTQQLAAHKATMQGK